MSTRAQAFAEELEQKYGPPLDAANIQEIGYRKTANQKLVLLYDWIVVEGNPDEKPDFVKCPKCGSMMIERSGKYGAFYGCSKYPDCRGTRRV